NKILDGIVNVEIGSITRVRILEATAIGAYRAETGAEVVKVLLMSKFGEAGLSLMPKIRGYVDQSRLRAITEALLKAKDIREIEGAL
ncbi:MAG: hypothetical protein HQL03_13810, partial [Nitrospirae bacterium]|nr:hypothetical protein [Nitrospirota bacterium]